MQNAYQTLKSSGASSEITTADVHAFVSRSLQTVGLSENEGVELWRKAILFQRLFHERGEAVFLDPLVHEQYHAFAMEKVSLERFQLSEDLRLGDFRSLLQFQTYLESVAPKTRGLTLPAAFLSAEEIEHKTPELVQKVFGIELVHVKKEELLQQVSLKETWDWELDAKNWETLIHEFPILDRQEADKREGRFALLEQIDPAMRLKIDHFAQGKLSIHILNGLKMHF